MQVNPRTCKLQLIACKLQAVMLTYVSAKTSMMKYSTVICELQVIMCELQAAMLTNVSGKTMMLKYMLKHVNYNLYQVSYKL